MQTLSYPNAILIPNIAWAGEGARQRSTDPLIDNNNAFSVGRRRDRRA